MAELSMSRINRQLRTLRMKCSSLAAFNAAPSKPAVSVTYGSARVAARSQDADETPPLAILQSLDNFGTRLHLDRAIVENMQLSKRIYEVRDALRNIVQSAIATADRRKEPCRILPLTAVCARLIGELVQSEIQAALDDAEELDGPEDDARAQAMDSLYEQVPPGYRPRMFIAHALTYILEACPHHPTLLNALLDVCFTYNLVPEAQTLLASLFAVAIKPRAHPTYPCPLTHPAHKNFLSTLRESCAASIINDRTFTRILVDNLSIASSVSLNAWTSKAITRLARDLRERDFAHSFVSLCSGLAFAVAHAKPATKSGLKRGKSPEDPHTKLFNDSLERLAKWVVSMLTLIQTSTSDTLVELRACIDFLVDVAPHNLHISDDPPASPPTCLADVLICLTTYCLASPHAATLHQSDLSALQHILRSAQIKNSTLDGLVSHIFPLPRFAMFAMPLAEPDGADTPTPPPSLPDVHENGVEALSALAAPLRAHGLLKCEAALWLAALQHVEELISAPTVTQSVTTPGRKLTQGQLYNLRLELMDRVEDAERRCFGGGVGVGGGVAGAVAHPDWEGEWEWEEMIGSWVLKSPASALAKKAKDDSRNNKRRRVESTSQTGPSLTLQRAPSGVRVREALAAARTSASTKTPARGRTGGSSREYSVSVCRSTSSLSRQSTLKRKASSASLSSTRAPSRAASSKENTSDDGEENVAPPKKAPRSALPPQPPRRSSNFATILADSQTNVISLRAEREARAAAVARESSFAPHRVHHLHHRPAAVSISAPAAPAQTHSRRRLSNFATLLADSQRNVISLREERERARKAQRAAAAVSFQGPSKYGRRPSASDDEDEDELLRSWASEVDVLEPGLESSPVRGAGLVHMSSDDALDLFAYPDSSPARRR
ncbi:hypothetical protein BV20DRAFT_993893 [Pilatotrama ljubarskyi]|nr:hypothetical protein BV20DRAFT_993893 [Pilatotrama ljubarskyi]